MGWFPLCCVLCMLAQSHSYNLLRQVTSGQQYGKGDGIADTEDVMGPNNANKAPYGGSPAYSDSKETNGGFPSAYGGNKVAYDSSKASFEGGSKSAYDANKAAYDGSKDSNGGFPSVYGGSKAAYDGSPSAYGTNTATSGGPKPANGGSPSVYGASKAAYGGPKETYGGGKQSASSGGGKTAYGDGGASKPESKPDASSQFGGGGSKTDYAGMNSKYTGAYGGSGANASAGFDWHSYVDKYASGFTSGGKKGPKKAGKTREMVSRQVKIKSLASVNATTTTRAPFSFKLFLLQKFAGYTTTQKPRVVKSNVEKQERVIADKPASPTKVSKFDWEGFLQKYTDYTTTAKPLLGKRGEGQESNLQSRQVKTASPTKASKFDWEGFLQKYTDYTTTAKPLLGKREGEQGDNKDVDSRQVKTASPTKASKFDWEGFLQKYTDYTTTAKPLLSRRGEGQYSNKDVESKQVKVKAASPTKASKFDWEGFLQKYTDYTTTAKPLLRLKEVPQSVEEKQVTAKLKAKKPFDWLGFLQEYAVTTAKPLLKKDVVEKQVTKIKAKPAKKPFDWLGFLQEYAVTSKPVAKKQMQPKKADSSTKQAIPDFTSMAGSFIPSKFMPGSPGGASQQASDKRAVLYMAKGSSVNDKPALFGKETEKNKMQDDLFKDFINKDIKEKETSNNSNIVNKPKKSTNSGNNDQTILDIKATSPEVDHVDTVVALKEAKAPGVETEGEPPAVNTQLWIEKITAYLAQMSSAKSKPETDKDTQQKEMAESNKVNDVKEVKEPVPKVSPEIQVDAKSTDNKVVEKGSSEIERQILALSSSNSNTTLGSVIGYWKEKNEKFPMYFGKK